MILSTLATKYTASEPHAFILIDKEQDNYPTKHLLYDVENPTLIEDGSGNKNNCIGIFSLSDEQFNNIINGIQCSPTSLFEVLSTDLHDISNKELTIPIN